MNTRLVNSAAGVILAALEQNRTPAGIALALDSAQLLLTPEITAELKRLQDRVAEVEAPRDGRTLDQVEEELTGANLSLWEEEQDNARLRLALQSAQRGRRRLRQQLAAVTAAAVEGRAALAAFCFDLEDPGTAALGALYLLQQATIGLGTLDPGETLPTVYRAAHDSIPVGLYLTAAAAREHCEVLLRRDLPTVDLDWIEDEEDGVAELVAAVGDEENFTGYVVTAHEVAMAYDPDADE